MCNKEITKRKEAAEALAKALNCINQLLPADPMRNINFIGDLESVCEVDENWNFKPNQQFIYSGHIDIEFQEKINNPGSIPTKQSNMNDIIDIDHQWEVILRRHESKCSDIQSDVKLLEDSGLKVTIGDLKDLINRGTALYEQSEQIAKSNASVFKLPKVRQKLFRESLAELTQVITDAREHLNFVLAINSGNSLSIDAFTKVEGKIQISEKWKSELEESFTIRQTEQRDKALKLIENVENAIAEINAFVIDNKFISKGIATYNDSGRCLCYLDENGKFHRYPEGLKYV